MGPAIAFHAQFLSSFFLPELCGSIDSVDSISVKVRSSGANRISDPISLRTVSLQLGRRHRVAHGKFSDATPGLLGPRVNKAAPKRVRRCGRVELRGPAILLLPFSASPLPGCHGRGSEREAAARERPISCPSSAPSSFFSEVLSTSCLPLSRTPALPL